MGEKRQLCGLAVGLLCVIAGVACIGTTASAAQIVFILPTYRFKAFSEAEDAAR